MKRRELICITWSGFPQYAARCVAEFACKSHAKVVVLATRSHVPLENIEKYAGAHVHVSWVDSHDSRSLQEVLGGIPDVVVQSGWATAAFARWGKECKRHGGRVICMVDNNFMPSWLEWIRAVRFQLFLEHCFDGFMVPGESGQQLLRFYGVPERLIRTGVYAADTDFFRCLCPLSQRPKRFLFVGQLIHRKNVLRLCEVFLRVYTRHPDWELVICGCGELRNQIPHHSAIIVQDFIQPENLCAIYNEARCFVLPSKKEHWGVVVHEAALCGCFLLLSEHVGAIHDLADTVNSFSFDPGSADEFECCMERVVTLSDKEMQFAETRSMDIATRFSPAYFSESLIRLLQP